MRGSWFVFSLLAATLAVNAAAQAAPPGTRPTEGLREAVLGVHALVGGRVVVSPTKTIEKATIVVRDGVITAVGPDVAVPADAQIWDVSGKTIYPGFIDAYSEQSLPEDVGSSAPYWNALVTPQAAVVDHLKVDGGSFERLRAQGITAELIAPAGGIWRGVSVLVATGDQGADRNVLSPRVAQHLRLTVPRGGRRSGFPGSPMGAVTLARQSMLDAAWYESAWQAHRTQASVPAPERNDALEALRGVVEQRQLVIAETSDEQFALRADQFAKEFNLRLAVHGSGHEYRQVEAIRALDRTFILPLDFPRPPQVGTAEAAANVAIEDLLHWDYAPENPARLDKAGIRFAFTLSGLKDAKEFLPAVRKAVKRGLSPTTALAAITTVPAELFGVQQRVGTIEPGKFASLVVAEGDLLTSNDAQIHQTWVLGKRFELKRPAPLDLKGRWTLTSAGGAGLPSPNLTLEVRRKKDDFEAEFQIAAPTPPTAEKKDAAPATTSDQPTTKPEAKSDAKAEGKAETPAATNEKPAEKPSESKKDKKEKKKKKKAGDEKPQPANTDKAGDKPAEKSTDNASAKPAEKVADKATDNPTEKPADPPAPQKVPLQNLLLRDTRLAAIFETDKWSKPGKAQLSTVILVATDGKLSLRGEITWADGSVSQFAGEREPEKAAPAPNSAESKPAAPTNNSPEAKPTTKPDSKPEGKPEGKADGKSDGKADEKKGDKPVEPAAFPLVYPLSAFGREKLPDAPSVVVFKDATIWTCGPAGVLENASLIVRNGLIEAVGKDLPVPAGAVVIDCRGRHLSPGIIDCHSHMATDGGINEATQSVTAEVRIGDFIDATDVNIYRQLAGGVTSSHILHGSANTIGGQCQLIKLRWGQLPEQLKFREAPPTIKFALGENVKQSNWDRNSGRYPQSRMGVDEVVRDTFSAARQYAADHERWNQTHEGLPPRRDLELDAIVEILERKRWIHCHSYRQDEILALLRTLEGFGVRVQTLQHILEGYKVADVMKKHGASGSSFSDWWAYKFEVIDAIPFNGSLMHNAGVVVSFNSDDRELARHLNHEAAKAVKYGGVPPVEALKFVTLNPAIQLHVQNLVGSLEAGKHADLVVWSSSPLSTMSRCEQTWVDGRKYFDREEDKLLRRRAQEVRAKLVQKILTSGESMRDQGESYQLERDQWARRDEYCNASGKGE